MKSRKGQLMNRKYDCLGFERVEKHKVRLFAARQNPPNWTKKIGKIIGA